MPKQIDWKAEGFSLPGDVEKYGTPRASGGIYFHLVVAFKKPRYEGGFFYAVWECGNASTTARLSAEPPQGKKPCPKCFAG